MFPLERVPSSLFPNLEAFEGCLHGPFLVMFADLRWGHRGRTR